MYTNELLLLEVFKRQAGFSLLKMCRNLGDSISVLSHLAVCSKDLVRYLQARRKFVSIARLITLVLISSSH